MTVRILTPTPTCCEPDPALRLHTGQIATCALGRRWIAVDAIDEGRGNHDWYTKWSVA
jgi:hypothetical protein